MLEEFATSCAIEEQRRDGISVFKELNNAELNHLSCLPTEPGSRSVIAFVSDTVKHKFNK
jgi:hypothetical protein